MSISKEKIVKNTKKYFDTANKYGFMNDELVEFLGTEFIEAPASTRLELHNAYEGGLIEHLLLVTKYGVSINSTLPEALQVEVPTLLKVCLLHQIGKAKVYEKNNSDWHNQRGIMYDFKNDATPMRIGERSVFYCMEYGIELTAEEYQAIINHDKSDEDKQAKWHSNTLGVILKTANELAIMEEKAKYKQSKIEE